MVEHFPRRPLQEHNANEREQRWRIIGNDFYDYLDDFDLVDNKAQIRPQLEWLREQNPPIIIDLMSTTSAANSLLHVLEKPYRALAVSYDEKLKPNQNIEGVMNLIGDLNKSETWAAMNSWLDGAKAHLIMARPFGGLQHIPTRASFYRAVTARCWEMLHPDGGTLLCQIPPRSILLRRQIPITSWTECLDEEHIDYQYLPQYESRDGTVNYGLFMLVKHLHTPNLPEIG